jgi:hypothetical protein
LFDSNLVRVNVLATLFRRRVTGVPIEVREKRRMTLEELVAGINDRRDYTRAELGDLFKAAAPALRAAAHAAVAKTLIRDALQAAADLAKEQKYADQGTLNAVQRLAEISDWDEPFIEVIKQLGIQAAAIPAGGSESRFRGRSAS